MSRISKESLITLAADQREVLASTGQLINHCGKVALGLLQFIPGNPLRFEQMPFNQFGTPRLYREIGLGEGDLVFRWIPVLGDEVAGETGEHQIVNFPSRLGTYLNHFPDIRKMVWNRRIADFEGRFALVRLWI